MQLKKPYRFNEQQKSYLEAKFNIGPIHRQECGPGCRLKRNTTCPRQRRGKAFWRFGNPNPPAGFFLFYRLAAKLRQQQVEVTPQDILVAEEQSNFSLARANVLPTLHVRHPIVVDHYDICYLVSN